MSMKYKIIVVLCLILTSQFSWGCSHDKREKVEGFARSLQEIIVNNKVDEFKLTNCFPDSCITNEAINHVFGRDDPSYIREFLSNDEVRVKIFGPTGVDLDGNSAQFSLVYYDPNVVYFESGFMPKDIREERWWDGYIETLILVQDGEVGFYRTPFYHGAHIPFVEY